MALQLRKLQSSAEIGLDVNTTVVFPAEPIGETRLVPAATNAAAPVTVPTADHMPAFNGGSKLS